LGLDRDSHVYLQRSRLNNQVSPVVQATFYAKPFTAEEAYGEEYK
jgi:hypothetical protein